ncbi:MAG TPA: response regulator, partial [Chloroflexota bacterium]|nr:response regulator [Chloroflexota bacterium]
TARLAAAQYDALVLDVRLPDGDGITLLGQLRAGGVATPALVYTAAGDVQIIARALRAGAQDYLSKDAAFTEGALDHALASLVARHGAETALRESEARFRALVEHSADAVVVVDAGGAVRYASPSVGGNIGYVPDELLGKSGRRRTGSIRWHPHPEPASQYCFDASIRTGAGGGSRRQVPTVSRTLSSAASSSTSVM